MNKYYIGIDTSSYTTSLAVLDDKDRIILNSREILKIKDGQRGLRQQEAVFQHVNNLPDLIGDMIKKIDISKIEVISCSSKPRNKENSYMPVFVVGKGQAFVLSKTIGCSYKEFSHQEGHIASVLLDNKSIVNNQFLSLHISGGTTELLLVDNKKQNSEIEIIGGTLDLNIGQLIDRIGVEAGLKFPCGKKMDEIAQKGSILDFTILIKIKDNTWFNLSGIENHFKKLIRSELYKIEDIFATLFHIISLFLYKVIVNSSIKYNLNNIVITGGVAANSILREYLTMELIKENIILYFPSIDLCTDNAVGIAYMGKNNKNTIKYLNR